MGLDILIYRNNRKNEIIEISEKLHKALFSHKDNISNLLLLAKIKDYYKTNIQFNADEIVIFFNELIKLSSQLNTPFSLEADYIIRKLDDKSIIKIHIAGD